MWLVACPGVSLWLLLAPDQPLSVFGVYESLRGWPRSQLGGCSVCVSSGPPHQEQSPCIHLGVLDHGPNAWSPTTARRSCPKLGLTHTHCPQSKARPHVFVYVSTVSDSNARAQTPTPSSQYATATTCVSHTPGLHQQRGGWWGVVGWWWAVWTAS